MDNDIKEFKSKMNIVINHLNCIDYNQEILNIISKYYVISGMFGRKKRNNGSSIESNIIQTIFGNINANLSLKTITPRQLYEFPTCCGVEVIGMTPSRTTDGKYAYKTYSITQLKQICKINKIKIPAKADKLEIVKLLLKI